MLLLLTIIAIGLFCLLDYYKRQFWIRKNVPHLPSIPFFGHFFPLVAQKGTAFGVYDKACHELEDKPYLGVYEFWRPTLVVRDLKLIEHILIKNFSSFLDHPRWVFDEKSPFENSLFNLKGDKWRALRYQMIPWFTTGRMKSLFPHILTSTYIPEGEFEVRKFIRIINGDTISAFFGAQICDKEQFLEMNKGIHDVSNLRYYKLLLLEYFSRFTKYVGLTILDPATEHFLKNFIKSVLANRNNALVQRMWKLVEDQRVMMRKKDLYSNSTEDAVYSYEVSEDIIMGIAVQLLVPGLDTTGNTMAWLMYDLAMHPEAQHKAREEIRNTLKKHGGWSYEAVQDMRYVANCIDESMRLHPTLPFVFRTCTSTYTTPDGLTIDKGTKIVIPALTIHMDPSIYPEPELFKPERLGDVEKQTNLTWMPFGEGPRKCIGMRFAQMVMRTTMARILENHELIFTEKTQYPVISDNRTFLGRPLNEMFAKLNKL